MPDGRLVIDRTWDGAPLAPDEHADVDVARRGDRLLVTVDAPWHGDPPPPGAPGRLDGLWEHEVVELFLVGADERYLELELGPHGHWLALLLEPPRRRLRDALEVDVARRMDPAGRWRGRASIALADLPEPIVRWNAFAIHGVGRERRWLAAWPLPGSGPDFHRIESVPEAPQRPAR